MEKGQERGRRFVDRKKMVQYREDGQGDRRRKQGQRGEGSQCGARSELGGYRRCHTQCVFKGSQRCSEDSPRGWNDQPALLGNMSMNGNNPLQEVHVYRI